MMWPPKDRLNHENIWEKDENIARISFPGDPSFLFRRSRIYDGKISSFQHDEPFYCQDLFDNAMNIVPLMDTLSKFQGVNVSLTFRGIKLVNLEREKQQRVDYF